MHWIDPGRLIDEELELILRFRSQGDAMRNWSPAYHFDMFRRDIGQKVGQIDLRVGNSHHLTHYAGHIGYGVDEEHRGRRYAARSVRLLLPLAKLHRLDPLWITCNPDNIPSRRSCEIAGAEFVEIVDLPEDTDMYREGERQKCRYRIRLSEVCSPSSTSERLG